MDVIAILAAVVGMMLGGVQPSPPAVPVPVECSAGDVAIVTGGVLRCSVGSGCPTGCVVVKDGEPIDGRGRAAR
jgi:hypothetical protein